jgi:hypothetical protein
VPEEHHDLADDRDADAQRARAIVENLRAGEPTSAEVFDAFWQLDALPVDHVREALAAWTGPLPDPDRLDVATRLAHGFPLPPLRLQVLSSTKDADVLDLGPMAEEQLRVAGKTWDGADLAPEDRLDGEIDGSFAGTLERRVLCDADAPEVPLFDVLLFAEDSGVVFEAGTAKVVALIAYGKVEMRDGRTRRALEQALAAPVPANVEEAEAAIAPIPAADEEAEAPAAPEETAAATPATIEAPATVEPEEPAPAPRVKKVSKKKAIGKKTAAKKKPAPAKKASAAKPAKKAAAKKAPAKKSAKKPAAATKAPAKKKAAAKAPKRAATKR